MQATPELQLPAQEVLQRSPLPALRKLSVEESDLVVVLTGSVGTYYLKQLAQETIMPILAGRELHNRVQVSGTRDEGRGMRGE